jgi:hypothetical protein
MRTWDMAKRRRSGLSPFPKTPPVVVTAGAVALGLIVACGSDETTIAPQDGPGGNIAPQPGPGGFGGTAGTGGTGGTAGAGGTASGGMGGDIAPQPGPGPGGGGMTGAGGS